ncbi:phage minor tail protein G [Photobacterium sp. 1_MG-2023]|uniref:phage minor tail protein domain-containing protein n=1 Tax=Photobacterium sp. 1_MG-2023 TaxID=3062646 RepID=UPI0026E15216|nr:phage minor tail protein G [Photobacterium sp. 1_MG-2023]MDO6707921.1 phage minor tail protein G [Photobacterium sp. 1_MG-2023]
MSFLKTDTIEINGQPLLLTELSGLERYEHMDYSTKLQSEAPAEPEPLAEGASPVEHETRLFALQKWSQAWAKLSYLAQVNLVAYGIKGFEAVQGQSQEDRRRWVQENLSDQSVVKVHNAVGYLSGMVFEPKDDMDEPASETEPAEPIDPKA